MAKVSNWGKYPVVDATIYEPKSLESLVSIVDTNTRLIARGNGRCYGDSSLQNNILSMLHFKKILEFDETKHTISCEAGILLDDILKFCVEKGFFLFVTPGTKFITLGGAIASNVHGKNHHSEGSFSNYVESLTIMLPSSEVLECSLNSNYDLFKETIGGMGLTGIIISAKIKLRKIETSYLETKKYLASNLNEMFNYFDENSKSTYSVAWLDGFASGESLGRGIFSTGEHLESKNAINQNCHLNYIADKNLKLPLKIAAIFLQPFFIKLFNK